MTAWWSRSSALGAVLATAGAWAQATPAQPIFAENFAAGWLDRWMISAGLAPAVRGLRIGTVADPLGRTVGRISVVSGDALQGATADELRLVCDLDGSRAEQMRAEPGGVAPSDRAEIQLRHDRPTGAGELVRFGEPVWYRFAFKVGADWPRDRPIPGREPCRTVIHQVKQDSFKNGESCSASPFFKLEARPLGDRLRFYGQIAHGSACARPPAVTRTLICLTDEVPREAWTTVNVRLLPAVDAGGRADMWLNGAHCGAYAGPMGDAIHGARRDGWPIANAQPRFGIYRDWRAETQTIYFDRIMFWDRDPAGAADWRVAPAPQSAARTRS